MKKIAIIGGVAGGASAAARLRRHSEEDQIVMFERGPHVSFSNCCLPYHLSGIVDSADKLVLMTPEKFMAQYNIDARVNSEVIDIDRENKEITVKNILTGENYKEKYDKLILSMGAKPIVPRIKGIENVNIFTIRNVVDIDRLNKFVKTCEKKKVTVIGGGFIGIETAENLREAGYDVTLIEAANQILRVFDYDMVQILHKELHDKGVNLIVEDKVVEFEKNMVVLESGKKVEAEAVVLAIGVTPDIELAKKAGLEVGKTGGIKVDQNYLTSDRDIYAVGDAIEVYNALYNDYFKLALAGPAQKQARGVADHINGMRIDNRGFIGSSVIKVFDYNGAATGLTENIIKDRNLSIKYETVESIPFDSVKLMPTARFLHFKLLYEVPTGRILGAQAIGKGDVAKRIDVIATVIKFGGTIDDLKDLELCYAPPFGTAKDVVNYGGYIATNLLDGSYKQVHFSKMRELVENNKFILDVREKNEYEAGHINGSVNIPLSEIRDRIGELPKDREIFIHCKSGQRSYNACLLLQHLGFKDVYNITAGFMGICFYEYFNDIRLGRKPIMDKYNFN
ncbi:Coenzyme A disulfide reductase [Fusobacterium sp. DD29]|uniref:FAD-dependent oxidoreductase n=1 Tax=unclassified Fusobacterium TaxID=2648384 RepID=UPI001B8D702A|nr:MULTISPECIES: FAD-dependent oxidoreductase [unclassified Fusobacterium]MBR8701637.1 Coenzyme A disulfide reductase [Fusobacterium sp. DD45]MBR8711418.1 Coenzyme A disulfide reductase [Fusobacterium sp. DD28]MBR8750504.1 Coenzyme A disulfide reductase [Fusobacterium sp. DD29]MBR8751953.1 Coenzyme A disulfide reductase [Fusobacterium sp. DD26]MBR8762752.1 Coenzyme A disulfide reductase [Fusobacterium sp. DD25]